MLNYSKLMAKNPTEYDRMLNSKGQVILFLESPARGDEAPIICVCHELKLAAYSGFYETDDMIALETDYEPWFCVETNTLQIGNLGQAG
jgi:hypothetical protein